MSRAGRLPRRLTRILALVPYVIQHPGVTLDELAQHFGVSIEDVQADLDLIFVCGVPGYGPGDLIEVTVQGDSVYVDTADYFEAPLKLTPVEALALYMGAAALTALPEVAKVDALERAVTKLGRALGTTPAADGSGIDVRLEGGPAEHLAALQRALRDRRRIRMEYFSAGRGRLSERTVEPWGLVAALGRWYLVALDHLSGEERMFRTDRIKSVDILDGSAEVPADFDPERYRGAFVGRSGEDRISLEIAPTAATWFGDYYPVEAAEDRPDGWRRIELVSGGLHWAATLVLRLGDQVRNVEPESVMAEARRLATAITDRHITASA